MEVRSAGSEEERPRLGSSIERPTGASPEICPEICPMGASPEIYPEIYPMGASPEICPEIYPMGASPEAAAASTRAELGARVRASRGISRDGSGAEFGVRPSPRVIPAMSERDVLKV
jgi:hypothetical protein